MAVTQPSRRGNASSAKRWRRSRATAATCPVERERLFVVIVSLIQSLESAVRAHLITGPNSGGKSKAKNVCLSNIQLLVRDQGTYLRQNALVVIMAQAGMFVPASRASIGVVDAIVSKATLQRFAFNDHSAAQFSRVGATDDLTNFQSSFMVRPRLSTICGSDIISLSRCRWRCWTRPRFSTRLRTSRW